MTRFLSDWGIRPSPKGPVHERKRHPSLSPTYVNLGLSRLLKGRVEVDLGLIHKRVAATLRIPPATLKSWVLTKHVIAARQIAMYLCRKLTDSGFPAVGESFRRDHSTAIFNYQQIARRVASESAFAEWLEKMEQQIAIDAVRRNLRRLGGPRVRTGRSKSSARSNE